MTYVLVAQDQGLSSHWWCWWDWTSLLVPEQACRQHPCQHWRCSAVLGLKGQPRGCDLHWGGFQAVLPAAPASLSPESLQLVSASFCRPTLDIILA